MAQATSFNTNAVIPEVLNVSKTYDKKNYMISFIVGTKSSSSANYTYKLIQIPFAMLNTDRDINDLEFAFGLISSNEYNWGAHLTLCVRSATRDWQKTGMFSSCQGTDNQYYYCNIYNPDGTIASADLQLTSNNLCNGNTWTVLFQGTQIGDDYNNYSAGRFNFAVIGNGVITDSAGQTIKVVNTFLDNTADVKQWSGSVSANPYYAFNFPSAFYTNPSDFEVKYVTKDGYTNVTSLPFNFNGQEVTNLIFNGQTVNHLYFNDNSIF